jgi:putative membrane protein
VNNISTMLRQFNWRALLIRFLINALTLFAVVLLTPKVTFVDRSLLNLLLLALGIGILNAVVKPIINFFTLPFIFATYGLVVVLVNSIILWLLALLFPDRFAVSSIFWALVAGALYGIISALLESLFGLNAPIISDEPGEAELRGRVETQSSGVVRTLIATEEAAHQQLAELPSTEATSETSEPATNLAAEAVAERVDREAIIGDVTRNSVTRNSVTTNEESES